MKYTVILNRSFGDARELQDWLNDLAQRGYELVTVDDSYYIFDSSKVDESKELNLINARLEAFVS